jgi:hypothetical protein
MEAIIDGKFKLVRSTSKHGTFDGFYGDDGRGLPNPPYDSAGVITSPVSIAIMALNINTSTIKQINKILQMRALATVTCEGRQRLYTGGPYCLSYCLFDLESDPCETVNLVLKYPDVTETLKKKLERFRSEMVPELSTSVDRTSNPAFFNNTWVCWLDDENVKKVPRSDVTSCNCTVSGSSANLPLPLYVSVLCVLFIFLYERHLNGFR